MLLLLLGLCSGWMLFEQRSTDNQTTNLNTARAWARLDPLPASATNLQIETRSGLFTREFIVTFKAPPDDIKRWLQVSPGPREARHETRADAIHYTITPGGGAGFAALDVALDYTFVRVWAKWN